MPKESSQKIRIYFDCRLEPDEIADFEKEGLQTEEATIKEAYFGRYPTPGPFTVGTPLGLNVYIDYKSFGSAGACYTSLEDMEGLMDDLEASRTEELNGKKVLAHVRGLRLIGLSAYQE